jgi:hypothetical protein
MAIARTGWEQFEIAATNAGSQNITVPAGTTLAVVCISTFESATAKYLSDGTVSLGDSLMSESPTVTDDDTSTWMGMVWYIVNPASGSNHIDWDFAGANNPYSGWNPHLYVVYYSGVDTVTPIRTSGGEHSVGANHSTASLTGLQSGDLAVIYAWIYYVDAGETISFTTGTQVDEHNATGGFNTAFAEHSPTGNTTYAITTGGDDGGRNVIVLRAAAGGAAVTGTATGAITELDVVTGLKTIILTLTGDTWITA